jgi:hypothetical protein
MQIFKTFFTTIAATLILCGVTYASERPSDFIGQAPSAVTEAQAKVDYRTVITGDFGGGIIDYIQKYNKIRQDGSKVRIDDLCMSACTLITGLVPYEDVCVSPYAIMAFHSAWVMTFAGPMHSKEGTALLWAVYPEPVKAKLREAGWGGGEHPEFIYFPATDFYKACE